MSEEALQKAYEVMTSRIGEQTSRSEWFEVTQERINDFAEVTMDHQWIHIDVEKAKAGPFGAPIAHGQLTLSIMGHLPRAAQPINEVKLHGQKMTLIMVLTKSDSQHLSQQDQRCALRAL